MVISAKQATQKAAEYLQEVKSVYNITLEEIELSEDEEYWWVTLGYTSNSILNQEETWKLFKVESETGKVLAMKSVR